MAAVYMRWWQRREVLLRRAGCCCWWLELLLMLRAAARALAVPWDPSLGWWMLQRARVGYEAAEWRIEACVESVCAAKEDRRAITVTSAEQPVQLAWI
jgi:hypothetical protein